MAINTDKNTYTVVFAVVMVSVVGSILAYLATGLKDRITENQRFEKQQNILYAMGVHNNEDDSSVNFIPTTEVGQRFDELIKGQYIIQEGKAVAAEDAYMIDLKKRSIWSNQASPASCHSLSENVTEAPTTFFQCTERAFGTPYGAICL